MKRLVRVRKTATGRVRCWLTDVHQTVTADEQLTNTSYKGYKVIQEKKTPITACTDTIGIQRLLPEIQAEFIHDHASIKQSTRHEPEA